MNKKTLKALLIILGICFCIIGIVGCGNTGSTGTGKISEGLEFTLNEDGESYSVSAGECTDTDIVIPETYNGKPVTAIADESFVECSSLTSIKIPDSVTSIGGECVFLLQ